MSTQARRPGPPPLPRKPVDGIERLIPRDNPDAIGAYYTGLFAIVPFLGLVLGIIAIVLGVRALRAVGRDPGVRGKTHAWVGIILGSIFLLFNLLLSLIAGIGLIAVLMEA